MHINISSISQSFNDNLYHLLIIMKKHQSYQCQYIQKLAHLFPISCHSNYTPDLEYSDKLILPPSIFFTIKQHHLPIPPVFSLRYNRETSTPVLCGVLEFTAEDDSLYAPLWILKKIGKRSEYSNNEVLLEILQAKKRNISAFPLLKKIEIYVEALLDLDSLKKALLMFTVVTKGEWLKFKINRKVYKICILSLLPRNKCLIKNANFELSVTDQYLEPFSEHLEEVRDTPLLEALPITLLAKERTIEIRKSEAYTPWEHRVQPMRLREEGIDLLPWDKEEIVKNEVTTQTLPDIYNIASKPRQKQARQRKILTLAFPQIHVPDRRPLTTLDIDIKYKSVSSSPKALRAYNNNHKNSMH